MICLPRTLSRRWCAAYAVAATLLLAAAPVAAPLARPVSPLFRSAGAPTAAPSADRAPAPPSVLFGPLFRAVQQARLFADQKTFADALPLRAPAAILTDYTRAPPVDADALRAFVLANFSLPADPAPPPPETAREPLVAHIARLWPVLTRQPTVPPPGSSALALPAPYVVPGGRFREIYYWDSYFTMLGLVADGRFDLVESMLDDFTSLIERYGHIPNGTRTYYLSRSQPPFFALMLGLSQTHDRATRTRRLAALRREHGFWMAGERCAAPACARVVRMPDGALLNRYFDDRAAPRDESWAQDTATATTAAPRPSEETWRDLRAAAESGWDFSARWLDDPAKLETIRTTAIVPVDLNSLLHAQEVRIARECAALGDPACARDYTGRAQARARAIRRWLWLPREARFADWDLVRRKPTRVLSAATLYPLFTGIASRREAVAAAATVRARLLAPGGLRTTTYRTGQQWDLPNGWAPLQWIAVEGLGRYGERALARTVACRFVATVARTYRETGRMNEKYDLEQRRIGGGGEYPTQDGFGWTNGVVRALTAGGEPGSARHMSGIATQCPEKS